MVNSIEFKLFAPYNNQAKLIGSFSEWQEIVMEKDEKGYFRSFVDLKDGVYQYKFRVQSKSWSLPPDEWVEINDPYVKEFDIQSKNGIVRIKDGGKIIDTYVWKNDDKPLPSDSELIIYEMHVEDFSGGKGDEGKKGTYQDIIDKLDYLSDLGINAIELMPVGECPGDGYSWGYTPSFFFSPNPRYGSTEDLKRLIDECHGRGIRVILDQLYNHCSEDNPLFHIDRDYWFYHDRHHPEDEYYWGPEFNYDGYDENLNICPAKEFMGDVVRYWIQEYHIDGIRYDALKQMDNFPFLEWITSEAKKTAGNKPFYNIGEHVPEKPDIVSPNGPIDASWHDSFHNFMVSELCTNTFDLEKIEEVLDPRRQGYPVGVSKVINYLSNHDQNRLIRDFGNCGIFDEPAFQRIELGATILMTAPGVPMIWMGQEFGEYTSRKPNEKNALHWSLLDNEANRNLLDVYKNLIALRKQHHHVLLMSDIEFFHENTDSHVLAYVRWNNEGSRMVVVANFSGNYFGEYVVPNFPENGTWHEWKDNYDVNVENNELRIDLPEFTAKVFIWH